MKVFDLFGAMPARRPRRMDEGLLSNPRGLHGLSDDYSQNVSNFKDLLSKQNQAAQKKWDDAHPSQEVYHAPQTPEYQPPPPPPEPDTREARDFSREGAIGPEMNLPPPSPPIMVHGGDEVPPPVPVPPKTPGGHAPVVTGVPDWNDRYYPPAPGVPYTPPDTSVCGPGYTRVVPGGPCLKNTPTEENHGAACYSCGGSMKWTGSPGSGCIPTGYSESTCKASGGGGVSLPSLPSVPSYGTAPVTPSIVSAPDAGSYTSFAGGGLEGMGKLHRSDGMGAPAFSKPIRMARRLW